MVQQHCVQRMPGLGVRLFCDEMLGRLGRWLRAAGYDTAIAEAGAADAEILARCAAEGRILLTRDRHLEQHAQPWSRVVLVAGSTIEAQARELRAVLAIDWQHAPFTRCLIDNAPLDPAPPELAAAVPSGSRAAGGPLRICPCCGRLYWPGGHVRRMQAKLLSFNR
jgi:uncharacterized protein with PIN domain